MSKSLLRLVLLSSPLALAACGEGWEVQRVSDYAPYGNSRTAGSGVAYVRAKMLPKKELVAEPVMEKMKAETKEKEGDAVEVAQEVKPMEEPAPVLEAEEIFTQAQQKGAVVPGVAAASLDEGGVKEGEEASLGEGYQQQGLSDDTEMAGDDDMMMNGGYAEEEGASFKGDADEEEHSSLMMNDDLRGLGTENYITQTPKTIVAPKVEVVRMDSYEPAAGGGKSMKTADIKGYYSADGEVVEVYEAEVVKPQKQIIVPKKDSWAYLSVGEEELREIYNQPF